MQPIFKSGQYVRVGNQEAWVPTYQWYVENRIERLDCFLDDLTDDQYAEYFLKHSPKLGCIDCHSRIHNVKDYFKKDGRDQHYEYNLLIVDKFGEVTNVWLHHVCEEKIKLSKKNMHKNP